MIGKHTLWDIFVQCISVTNVFNFVIFFGGIAVFILSLNAFTSFAVVVVKNAKKADSAQMPTLNMGLFLIKRKTT